MQKKIVGKLLYPWLIIVEFCLHVDFNVDNTLLCGLVVLHSLSAPRSLMQVLLDWLYDGDEPVSAYRGIYKCSAVYNSNKT